MFDSLKSRFHRKSYDDVEDIRSNVLGDFRGLPPEPQPDFPRRDRPVEAPVWEDIPRDEPPGFNTIDTRFPQPQQRDRDYDILDRLSLIESQLSAIRSQTETINERLKNMERSLGRRY